LIECNDSYEVGINDKGGISCDRNYWLETDDCTLVNGKWAVKNNVPQLFKLDGEIVRGNRYVRVFTRSNLSELSWQTIVRNPGNAQPLEQTRSRVHVPRLNRFLENESEFYLCTDPQAYKPDDLQYSGVTIMTMATKEAITRAFNISKVETISRFRPNLIIEGEEIKPFDEFSWVGRRISVGHVFFWTVEQICIRCPVIGVNPFTGEYDRMFLKEFGKWVLRENYLFKAPEHARRMKSDGTLQGTFCAVNTSPAGTMPQFVSLTTGMEVSISP
jgi:hypothetical protein